MTERRIVAIRQTLAIGLAMLAFLFVVGRCTTGCAMFTKPFARGVLDFVQIACIIQNATLGDARVAQVCAVANDLMPDLRRLLEQQRAELARAREEGEYAATHRPDAGAPFVLDAGVLRLTP